MIDPNFNSNTNSNRNAVCKASSKEGITSLLCGSNSENAPTLLKDLGNLYQYL